MTEPVASNQPLLPGSTLGVLGGGQLGRMWAHEAQRMGYQTVVLDPDPNSPAGAISHRHLCAEYTDAQALQDMAALCQAVTTEFENVPAEALAQLAKVLPVAPAADAVAVAQDRAREKAHFVACGVPVAPYALIDTSAHLAEVPDHLLPGILKTARMGYDGKGQQRVRTREELARAWQALQCVPCVLEKMLPLQMECSVVVARGRDGAMVHLPLQRNLHRDGILARTEVWPGHVPAALAQQAIDAAKAVAQGLHYVGVLCVEFFVVQEAGVLSLVVNEIAPRPHNSGHYSQDACDVSQFELQVRCMTGLPLTQPHLHSPAIMLNLLGDVWFKNSEKSGSEPNFSASEFGAPRESEKLGSDPDFSQLLRLPGVHLHLYGKSQARVGRKMGHINITAATPEAACATAEQVAAILGLAPFEFAHIFNAHLLHVTHPHPMILNGNDPTAIAQAAQALQCGELLGLPTETVYGLAADAGNDAAVKAIFQTKGRPSDHPLIVHVAHAQGAQHFASEVPEFAQRLMDAFWPGPLTLILPRQPQVAELAAGAQDSVGLRCPAHPVAQAVLQAAEGLGVRGVAAPSANRFGRVSPTTAAHVAAELGNDLLIVDGGACEVGIESTIIDCTRGQPVLLRPGVLTPAELSAACGLTVRLPTQEADADAPRASGTLASHYAPHARVCLMPLAQLQQALQGEAKAIAPGLGQAIGQGQAQGQVEALAHAPAPTHHTTADAANTAHWVVWTRSLSGPDASWPAGVRWVSMPNDPAQCAHELFAQLRAFDDAGITHIWVESPPLAPEWAGVLDRLSRAASPDR